MPEYPDITIYIERLQYFIKDRQLQQVRVGNPFFLRTFNPPLESIKGLTLTDIKRIGKRIVFVFTDEYFLVLHLMISGRLHWHEAGYKIPKKKGLAALDFGNGSLLITEVSTKKRASLHLVRGREQLKFFGRGGLEVFDATLEDFQSVIKRENHTLKRTLTDPRILSGIGNAYSDEILHHARLSPVLQTRNLTEVQSNQLFNSIKSVLLERTQWIREEVGDLFPEKVTAFRDDMTVHGRYGKPCPKCGSEVQRIRYLSNETNYCPGCQTEGKLLADRSLSRLLKNDWPRTLEELEELQGIK
jgi:formamidopyrimidine-DNA glycosylase